jgi:hypothetical protein
VPIAVRGVTSTPLTVPLNEASLGAVQVGEVKMELLNPRCAGLDVHTKTVVASVRVVEEGGVRREPRTFGTTTTELYKLFDWLQHDRRGDTRSTSSG